MHAPEASLYRSILIICCLLGSLIIFFIYSIMRQHRKNIAMYKSKLSAEITMLEKERARIAKDLHDDLGPLLTVIKYNIETVEVGEEDAVILRNAEQNIDDVIQKLRLISNDLLPTILTYKGLIEAVIHFIENLPTDKMTFTFTHEILPKLDPELAVNLYRMIQEIIHNAIKHSSATELKIDIKMSDQLLELTCSDNGKGFDFHKAQREKTGLGLRNVWSRAELLHGNVYLESAPGKGTIYTIELPVSKPL